MRSWGGCARTGRTIGSGANTSPTSRLSSSSRDGRPDRLQLRLVRGRAGAALPAGGGGTHRPHLRRRHGPGARGGAGAGGAPPGPRPPPAPHGRRRRRGLPEHAAAHPDLHRLLRAAPARAQALALPQRALRAGALRGRLQRRNLPGRPGGGAQGAVRGGALHGPHRAPGAALRDRSPGGPHLVPRARQQPGLAGQELVAGVDHRHGRTDVRGQRHLLQQLPHVRDLRGRRRPLHRPRPGAHPAPAPGRRAPAAGPVNLTVVVETLPYLLRGTVSTVAIAAAVVVLGTAAGVVLGLLRFVPWTWLETVVAWVVELVRAVPLLLLIFFIFFGLPALNIRIPTFPAAVLAMSLWMAVNTSEVVRGGITSIPRGQFEAARSTGLTGLQTMRYVIFPQAVRRMIPPFVGLCTILVKDTSLAAIIGVFELTRAAQETIERTLRSFEIYLVTAAIYFAICFPLTRFAQKAEARLHRP